MVAIPQVIMNSVMGQSSTQSTETAGLDEELGQFLEQLEDSGEATRGPSGRMEELIFHGTGASATIESKRLSNIRFNLRKLLTSPEVPKAVLAWGKGIDSFQILSSIGPDTWPWAILGAAALSFLHAAKEIGDIAFIKELEPDDVLVVTELYRWHVDRNRINLDEFYETMETRQTGSLSKQRIIESLDRLAAVQAIGYVEGDSEIHLLDTVVFR
jgi:hypothetical protein